MSYKPLSYIEVQLTFEEDGFPPLICWRSPYCSPSIQIFTYIYICIDANLSFPFLWFLFSGNIQYSPKDLEKILQYYERSIMFKITWIAKIFNKAISLLGFLFWLLLLNGIKTTISPQAQHNVTFRIILFSLTFLKIVPKYSSEEYFMFSNFVLTLSRKKCTDVKRVVKFGWTWWTDIPGQ